MVDLKNLKTANAIRWANAKVTRAGFTGVAKALVEPEAKARYLSVSSKTGVPWAIIAVIHEREASQRWDTQLGQGDPLDRVSVHIPSGRGPFATWEEGAFDALTNSPPHASGWGDWSIGGALTLLEMYNGTGYANRELPSPYIWAGTDQYKSGKYVRDGVYDPHVIDSQLGCAGLLKVMMTMDSSITFGLTQPPAPNVTIPSPTTTIPFPKAPPRPPVAPQPKPSKVGGFADFLKWLLGKK